MSEQDIPPPSEAIEISKPVENAEPSAPKKRPSRRKTPAVSGASESTAVPDPKEPPKDSKDEKEEKK